MLANVNQAGNNPAGNNQHVSSATAIAGRGEIAAAFVTSCDVPLLMPAFVRRMVDRLGEVAVAVPKIDGRLHPLAAVYRLAVLPEVERRLTVNELRLTDLVEALNPRIVSPDELRDIDPQLQSLRNINDPVEYHAALAGVNAGTR